MVAATCHRGPRPPGKAPTRAPPSVATPPTSVATPPTSVATPPTSVARPSTSQVGVERRVLMRDVRSRGRRGAEIPHNHDGMGLTYVAGSSRSRARSMACGRSAFGGLGDQMEETYVPLKPMDWRERWTAIYQ